MSTLFISYSTKDSSVSDHIFQGLVDLGYPKSNLFRDSHPESGIPVGSKWEQELYRKLHLSRALIVLCSTSWLESKWCFAELAYAKAMGKDFFPVLIDQCSLPSTVSERQVLRYAEPDFWPRLERSLIAAGMSAENDFPWPVEGEDPCPFPGLHSFEPHHAGVFFGREREAQELCEKMTQMASRGNPRLLILFGASGSGKSSLVKAGLIPRLQRNSKQWMVFPTFRWNHLSRHGRNWPEQLALNLLSEWPDSPEKPKRKDLQARYEVSESNSVTVVGRNFIDDTKDVLLARGRSDATPVLFLDQLEELLGRHSDEETDVFLELMQALALSAESPWRLIATIRSDFMPALQRHPRMINCREQTATIPIYQLGIDRFYEAINGPAQKSGITLRPESLVHTMVTDTATTDALPLLAFTLNELYERFGNSGEFTLDAYRDELGGLEGCLDRAAEETLAEFLQARNFSSSAASSETAEFLRSFSNQLVEIEDDDEEERFVRRTAVYKEFDEAFQPLIDAYVNRRLLVSRTKDKEEEGGIRVIELAHEAILRKWERLRNWLEHRREIFVWRKSVARSQRADGDHWNGLSKAQLATAESWNEEQRSDLTVIERSMVQRARSTLQREAQKRQRRLVVLTTLFGILATSAGVFAWMAKRESNEKDVAIGEKDHAFEERGVALGLKDTALKEVEAANDRNVDLLASNALKAGETRIADGDLVGALGWFAEAYTSARKSSGQSASARNLLAAWGRFLPNAYPIRTNDDTLLQGARSLLTADREPGKFWMPRGHLAVLWNSQTGDQEESLEHDEGENVREIIVSPAGSLIATTLSNGDVCLWDRVTFHLVHRIENAGDSVIFRRDDGAMLSWHGEMLCVYEKESKTEEWHTLCEDHILFASFLNERAIGIVGKSGQSHIGWLGSPSESVESIQYNNLQEEEILEVNADRSTFVTRTSKSLKVYDSDGCRREIEFADEHGNLRALSGGAPVDSVALSRDCNTLAVAFRTGYLAFIDINKPPDLIVPIRIEIAKDSSFLLDSTVFMSPNGRFAVVIPNVLKRELQLWDLRTQRRIGPQLRIEDDLFLADLEFDSTGDTLTGFCLPFEIKDQSHPPDSVVKVWDIEGITLPRRLVSRGRAGDVAVIKRANLLRINSGIRSDVLRTSGTPFEVIDKESKILGMDVGETGVVAYATGSGFVNDEVLHVEKEQTELWTKEVKSGLDALSLSPDGRFLAVMKDTKIWIYEAATGSLLTEDPLIHDDEYASSLEGIFSDDGNYLAVTSTRKVNLWETRTWNEISPFQTNCDSIEFSPDSKFLFEKFQGSTDSSGIRWTSDGREFELALAEPPLDLSIQKFACSENSVLWIVANTVRKPSVRYLLSYDPSQNKVIHKRQLIAPCTDIVCSPSGNRIVIATDDDQVQLWERSGDQELIQTGVIKIGTKWDHTMGYGVRPIRFAISPDGTRLATAGTDRNLRLWDIHAGQLLGPPVSFMDIKKLDFTFDGRHLVANTDGGTGVFDLPELALQDAAEVWSFLGQTTELKSDSRKYRQLTTEQSKAHATSPVQWPERPSKAVEKAEEH